MAIKKELIQFTIINQTDCTFNLPLFQSNVYSINATTKYSWDITTADLSCGTGTIVINGVTINLSFAANLAGLLSALNSLGYGFFCTETIGFSTFLYVVDDTNIYGDLDLCPAVVPTTTTTTTTSTTTAAPTTTTTTTTSTTTEAPTTTTTTSTTTEAPTTTTTTTTSTTTAAPTTTTTTSTTTEAPTTTTTTSTTTEAPTTTTTTSTTTTEPPTSTTTTTTTTTLACDNVEFLEIEVSVGGTVNYIDCYETPRTQSVGAGTEFIGTGTGVLVSTLSGTAVYTITTYGSCCLASTTTTTTSTTTAAPTTTTTTTSTTIAFSSGSVKFSNNDATICDTPVTIITAYWDASFPIIDTNVTLYYDSALTSPVTGYSFAVQNISGYQIFDVTSSTGFVTGGTGIFCTGTTTTTTTSTTTAAP